MARHSSGRQLLSAKTPREKVTELFGSLLLSAAVAGAASLLMLIVQHRDQQFYSEYVWLGLCAAIGAWGVLIPAKLWEGREGDAVLRRFVMLGIGLAFGLAAFETGPRLLKIVLENEVRLPHLGIDKQSSSSVEGQPEVMNYLAYFGFLFLLLRWWKQADPLRSIMEIADVLVVNKSDLPNADLLARQLSSIVDASPAGRRTPIVKTAGALNEGVDALLDEIDAHREYIRSSGVAEQHRRAHARHQVLALARQRMIDRLVAQHTDGRLEELVEKVAVRELDPHSAADLLIGE